MVGCSSNPCRARAASLRRDGHMTSNLDAAISRRPPIGLLDKASLFLDFDGTIVSIAPRPDAVRITMRLRQILERLIERLNGRVAILTGRSAADVEQMIHPLSLAIGGHHGLEMRIEGISTGIERPALLDELIEQLRTLEREYPGVLIEEKPLGIALHYRQAPGAGEACRVAVERAAEQSGFEVQPGKMVFEIKPRGADKGIALRQLMDQKRFRGTTPVAIGDDLTDEPAFVAAQELGGAGVIVGAREPSAARYRLRSVPQALQWLHQACEAIA